MAALHATAVERVLYPLFRRYGFRGQGRLRDALPMATEGTRVVRFPEGFRLRLDLRESLQRDFLFGLYDRLELGIVRNVLGRGGDALDVGAHIGFYTVACATALGGRGRVLSFEPNPGARAQLEANVALNGLEGVTVLSKGASDEPGTARLHVPTTYDPSFSSLQERDFDEGEAVEVDLTTVDAEVERLGFVPAFVKVDVEGNEVRVVHGMERTLDAGPVVLCEVGPESAAEVERLLVARGFSAYRVAGRRVVPGVAEGTGWFNALFLPDDRPLRTILP